MEKETKRLYRSRKDKIIGGVCGGIAEYFNIDPVWVRLVAVLLALADGIGIILYIIAWILIPKNPGQKEGKVTAAEKAVGKVAEKTTVKKTDASVVLGLILVLIGGGLLLKKFFTISWQYVWPAAIIVFGLYLLVRKK